MDCRRVVWTAIVPPSNRHRPATLITPRSHDFVPSNLPQILPIFILYSFEVRNILFQFHLLIFP